MTSRSYAKSYNRKVGSVTAGSIQFDKLFRENSNRPSAAKSAGTVGKWGITSFTSIRSTNINGRRDDITKTFGPAKRMKLDYANQNSNANSNSVKDPFSFEPDDSANNKQSAQIPIPIPIPTPKPKKFFKSRNAATTDSSKQDPTNLLESNGSNHNRRPPKSQTTSPKPKVAAHKTIKKAPEVVENNEREDKPPIVLRICKGTARLISADDDSDRIDEDPKLKLDEKKLAAEITTVSIPLEETLTSRRTTRSRAKNLQVDGKPSGISSNLAASPSAQVSGSSSCASSSSGLSLTLRKSVTDSNNTLISHYDIVKTDCPSTKPVIEPLIGRDQPVPTSTQELIAILSSDADKIGDKSDKSEEEQEEVKELPENPRINEKLPTNPSIDEGLATMPAPTAAPVSIVEDLPENLSIADDNPSVKENLASVKEESIGNLRVFEEKIEEKPIAKTIDQDWSSGSEDSANAEVETPIEPPIESSTAASKKGSTIKSKVKPVTKKGSIFKSRTGASKRRALYKHKWCDDKDKDPVTSESGSISGQASVRNISSIISEEELEASKTTRVTTYPEFDENFEDSDAITSVRCDKKVKRFYTVIRNVKKAHQIQESGEFQEFNDDVEYILDTLRENNPNGTRCLSAIRLANKCMAPAFRMHVRAHGTVAKFFKALHDATKDQSLGLCTATVMFVLSQDRLAMDLDRDCLELMLNLLESEANKDSLDDCGLSRTELLKNKEKVRQLCADIQQQGHAEHLNLDNITAGQLAMETLLSLTSKRAGEWFKEELRHLGGLEYIVKTIRDCQTNILASDFANGWTDPLLDKLRKVDRCLRVLENVTHENEENQVYLLNHNQGCLVNSLVCLFQLCQQQVSVYPTVDSADKTSTGAVIRECLFAILKVLMNLTHRFNSESFGGKIVGSKSGVINCSLILLLCMPENLPEKKRFDMMMLSLILLINLVEQCDDNKKLFMESKVPLNSKNDETDQDDTLQCETSGLDALIDLFYKHEELARGEEQKTDAILDGKKDSEQTETVSTTTKTQEEFIEETVSKLLQKAGRHMEHTLIGAYVVLLLGYLIMDNKEYELLVRSKLPSNNFSTMVPVLQKFFNFMNLTVTREASCYGIAATEKVIKFLKLSDALAEEEKNALPLPALGKFSNSDSS